MGYHWNWGILLQPEPGGTGTYLHYLLVGLVWTLCTALAAWVIALVVGSIVGTLRTTPNKWVVRAGNFYVEIFRNIPLIVQMFLWFFVFPELLPVKLGDAVKQITHRPLSAWYILSCAEGEISDIGDLRLNLQLKRKPVSNLPDFVLEGSVFQQVSCSKDKDVCN